MEECKIQRDAELRTFTARLKELEGARLAQRFFRRGRPGAGRGAVRR